MNRITTLTAAIAFALASGAALADDGGGDNSMSRWTGDSHAAFEAARVHSPGYARERRVEFNSLGGENSMSRWTGESYVAFEAARLQARGEPRSAFAQARSQGPHRLEIAKVRHGRETTPAFSDTTG